MQARGYAHQVPLAGNHGVQVAAEFANWWQALGEAGSRLWARFLPTIAVIAFSVVSIFDSVAPQRTEMGSSIWPPIVDVPAFSEIGNAMLSGDLAATYATPFNQTGPLQPVLSHLLWITASSFRETLGWDLLQIAIAAGLLGSVVLTVRIGADALGLAPQAWVLELTAVSVLAAMGAPADYFAEGHWWQIPVLWLWWIASLAIVRGRVFIPAIALAASMALEPWGVLGVVLIVFAPEFKVMIRAGIVTLLMLSAIWLPFLLMWPFAMGSYQWKVREDSLWALIGFGGSEFSWLMRSLQAAAILASCIVVFWSWRATIRESNAFCSIALLSAGPMIVLFRVGLDLHFGGYYLVTTAVFLVPIALLTLFAWGKSAFPVAISAYLVLVATAGWQPFAISLIAGMSLALGLWLSAIRLRVQIPIAPEVA